eukprot:7389167-Prymnesium_polylepis.2
MQSPSRTHGPETTAVGGDAGGSGGGGGGGGAARKVPTTLDPSGANTTILPIAAAPPNFWAMVRLPVGIEASKVPVITS